MTNLINSTFIHIIHPVCCGLDVHKDKISACLITLDENGKEQHEIREFTTFTKDLLEMKEWLIENDCLILVKWTPCQGQGNRI